MSISKIIKLTPNPQGFGDVADELETEMFASQLPVQHSHSDFEDEDFGLYIGVWDTSDMVEAAGAYPCHEFMTVIEGAVAIKNNVTGEIENVIAGESFVIPKDYDCQWIQKGYLRKFYVIYEPASENGDAASVDLQQPSGIIIINENSQTPWQETSDGHRKKVLFNGENGGFVSGVWHTESLKTDTTSFPYNEFFTIKAGSITCTEVIGEERIEHEFTTGDSVFIPKNTTCSWVISQSTTLHFVQIK